MISTGGRGVTSMMTEGEMSIFGIDTKGTILRSVTGDVVENNDIRTNRDTTITATTQNTNKEVSIEGMSARHGLGVSLKPDTNQAILQTEQRRPEEANRIVPGIPLVSE